MNQARAGGGRLRDNGRALRLHRVERLTAALEQDADEIDDDVASCDGGLDRGRIAQVRLHGMDLPDAAERLQMAGEIGPPHRDADAEIAPRQRAHDMAPEEAGAAENRDQSVEVGLAPPCRSSAAQACLHGALADAREYRMALGLYSAKPAAAAR